MTVVVILVPLQAGAVDGRPGGSAPDTSEAFDVAVRPYLQALHVRALRLTRDRDAADDLLQDTLERGYRKRALFRPGTDLRAWLLTIMRNTWVNSHRRRAAEVSTISLDALDEADAHAPVPARGPEGSVVERVVVEGLGEHQILSAIDALPPMFREVLTLVDVDGEEYRHVAKVLQIPVGSVCSRLSRARRRIRQALQEAG
jgi:RNA polymerase sigma-70 factor (ECF subfamily)